MNKVFLAGRLTREPEVRYSQGENAMAIASYTLAIDRKQSRNNGDENSADFIRCTAFGKQAEFVEKYLHKGTKMIISGRIQTGSYTNKEGVKVYTTDIVVDEHEFAESKGNDNHSSTSSQSNASNSNTSSPSGDGFMNIPDGIDEELPFN